MLVYCMESKNKKDEVKDLTGSLYNVLRREIFLSKCLSQPRSNRVQVKETFTEILGQG